MANTWDLRRLQIECSKERVQPLYLIYGEEAFLIDEALTVLKAAALGDALSDFNLDTFFTTETKVENVRDTVEMLPMMSQRRVVVYKDVQMLKESQWETLYPILENPLDTTCFILVANKIDKRKKSFKKISQAGVIVELKRPYENQIPVWIDYIASKFSMTLEPEAKSMVQQFVGSNLSEIYSEMSKVHSLMGAGAHITTDDVLQVISRSKVETVFDLAKAIGENDRARALTCLANLLEYGQNEIGALALIARHVRILSTIKEGLRAGLTGTRLSSKAGVPHFFLGDYVGQTKHWTDKKISKTIHALHETDRALKSSPISGHIWLENFIIKTCSPSA